MVSRSDTMAFVTVNQMTRFRDEIYDHMNDTVGQFRTLLENAERSFGNLSQRMELLDSFLDAKFRDYEDISGRMELKLNAVQLRAEESFNKLILYETELDQMKFKDQALRDGLDRSLYELEKKVDKGGSSHGKMGGRDLLDPKHMTVSRFDGSKAEF